MRFTFSKEPKELREKEARHVREDCYEHNIPNIQEKKEACYAKKDC